VIGPDDDLPAEELSSDEPAAAWDHDVGLVAIPAYQTGGRVERTGLALVHEGEEIRPAQWSAAEIAPARSAAEPIANWYLPVEVEVVGELDEAQKDAVASHIYEALRAALRSRA